MWHDGKVWPWKCSFYWCDLWHQWQEGRSHLPSVSTFDVANAFALIWPSPFLDWRCMSYSMFYCFGFTVSSSHGDGLWWMAQWYTIAFIVTSQIAQEDLTPWMRALDYNIKEKPQWMSNAFIINCAQGEINNLRYGLFLGLHAHLLRDMSL